jgi:cell division protein FtsW
MKSADGMGISKQAMKPGRMKLFGLDVWFLIIVFAMLVFGLIMVYSASWDVSWRLYENRNAIFQRQIINTVVGLATMAIAVVIPLRWLRSLALPVMLFAILMLLAVLLISAGGAPRRAIFGASVQPSELAKLALIIYLAVWMESKGERLLEWGYGLMPLVVILGIVCGLILLQPDLSAAITIAFVAFFMFYLAGAKWDQILSIALGSGAVVFLLVRATNTGRQRWEDFRNGLVNIEEASYHVKESLKAFYSGGVLGRGLGASRAKFGFLPAPHTDSIFAVIGEELGLLGALLVLVLFALLIWRGFQIAMSRTDQLTVLLAGGIMFWIAIEGVVNMAVLLGLLPFAGNALPFFSYGGSSLVTTLTGVGFLLNISRKSSIDPTEKKHVTTLSLGRGNRRRRVSRLGRHRKTARES